MPTLFRRWITALYAAKITPATRDTLTAYGIHMDRDGVIVVPITTIAEWTGRGERMVTRQIAEGRRHGLLTPADKPNHGRPATYRATIPPTPR